MKFLNVDCGLLHGNLRISSIFTTPSGEWKLGGYETLCSLKDDHPIFCLYSSRVAGLGKYFAPETIKGRTRDYPPSATDGYAFGCLIYELFNGAFSKPDELGNRGLIPTNLIEPFHALLNPNVSRRMDFSLFLEVTTRPGGYFNNDMIWITSFLEEINIKEAHEKEQFLK